MWLEKDKPNAAWAKCYGADFDRTMAFLEQSRQAHTEELASEERHRKEELRKVRLFAGAITALFLVAALFAAWGWHETYIAKAAKQTADRNASLVATQAAEADVAKRNAEEAARKATSAEIQAETERHEAQLARQQEERKADEAFQALEGARRAKDRADQMSSEALNYVGLTIRQWQTLSSAITDQHEARDFYEKLLTNAESIPNKIMQHSPDNRDAMALWVVDAVGISDLHYHQKRFDQAQTECAKHEATARDWAQTIDPLSVFSPLRFFRIPPSFVCASEMTPSRSRTLAAG